ncbi:putative transferase CAF17 homolog, mitochondrial [Hydra vulgaris]|uniref:Transferase CAF17 homolog, mitochondrial n=1 Tax=Hydra vulgaris TaxID=6087 RepID=A0ABM4DJZ4_HYDVU
MQIKTCYKIITTNFKNIFTRNLITGKTIVPIKCNGVISVHGKDCKKLLQGMITNDVSLLDNNLVNCIYSMVLNVQGRILYDLFLYKYEHGYLMECNSCFKDELVSYLSQYKLRSKVFFENRDDLNVYVSFSSDTFDDFVVDPRLPKLGYRNLSTKKIVENEFDDISCYTNLRYQLGISEGVEVINGIPLEHNLALLNGVSFTKGCYIGQELVARAHHTGVIRKRVVPLLLSREHCLLNGNTVCIDGDFQVGKLLGISGKNAIGLLRLKEIFDDKNKLHIKDSDVSVKAFKPDWWPDNLTYK